MSIPRSRRAFLKASATLAVAAAAAGSVDAVAETPGIPQEYYELRMYQTQTAEKQRMVEDYLEQALIPALGRMNIHRVGAFTSTDATDHTLYVLIPYRSLDVFAAVNPELLSDSQYQDAAKAHFAVPKDDPLFSRIHSRLYKAFAGMPVMELPVQTTERRARIFELRIYQSHTEEKAALKVDMFNRGEIQVMRDTGLAPVFFGEALIGDDVPNLAYMLSASDREAHQAHWSSFANHPEWNRMKKMPRYLDTVSHITSTFLTPTAYSQL